MASSSIHVTPPAIVGYLQVASTAALVIIAALTARDWLATRDRSRVYLVLAIGSLAAVSLLGQVGKLLGSWFAAASGSVTVVLFLASGLALLMFRDSVIPLSRRTRLVVLSVVGATAVLEIGLQLIGGRAAPRTIQLGALVAFVLVWVGCVGEPSVRLWLEARGRTAVQRARMRALSFAYLAIVAILLAAVFTSSLAKEPAVQVGFALAGLAIIPLLYAAFVPPAWLRRLWRQGEEAKLQEATHDIVLFSPDRATLAGRALDWAVRLTGADSGLFVGSDGQMLASHRMTGEAAAAVRKQLAASGDQPVIALGGTPPRNAVIVEIPGAKARIILITGPFTPVFGTDEQSWIRQYASLISTGLDRVRLVEAVERANGDLQAKVEEVIERTSQLEAANRELEAFSYTISHDLRAPLRAINGFTSILLDDFAESLPEQARGYLVKVKANGEQMGRLVDDLLAFSRLGRQGLRQQPVNTREIVDRALAVLSPSMENRNIEIVVGDLPEVQADPGLLEQVFVNLLSNAIKYTQKKPSAHIEVGAFTKAGENDPTIFVRDNGAGFDMTYADKLFGVFQRLHRSQDYEGSGVGLAIAHRIIDRHGGRIWADAKVEQGATFYFTLKGVQVWQQSKAA
jgi:signal transduction histidine kinase